VTEVKEILGFALLSRKIAKRKIVERNFAPATVP